MDRRRIDFAPLLSAAVMGLSAALVTGAAAQPPEIRFETLDPATALPASAEPAKTEGVSALETEKSVPAAPADLGPRLKPHVGLDLGGGGATLDALSRPAPAAQNSSDPDRRYRAQAGIDYDVNSKIQLGLGYRYSNYERPDLVLAPAPMTELESQQREQAAKFSLRYKLGGP